MKKKMEEEEKLTAENKARKEQIKSNIKDKQEKVFMQKKQMQDLIKSEREVSSTLSAFCQESQPKDIASNR